MRSRLCLIGLLLACELLASAGSVQAEKKGRKPDFRVVCTPLKSAAAEDRIRVMSCQSRLVRLEVRYGRGIGGAKLDFEKGFKPEKIELLFKNFGSMESFSIQSGRRAYSSNLKQSPISWMSEFDENGKRIKEEESNLKIDIKGWQRKQIRVCIPFAQIAGDSPQCSIGWIDAYR